MLNTRTAGDPDDETIIFTDLSPAILSKKLDALGTPACDDTIRAWMDEENLRKIRKDLAGGSHPDRNAQFERIAALIDQYESEGKPVGSKYSADVKSLQI